MHGVRQFGWVDGWVRGCVGIGGEGFVPYVLHNHPRLQRTKHAASAIWITARPHDARTCISAATSGTTRFILNRVVVVVAVVVVIAVLVLMAAVAVVVVVMMADDGGENWGGDNAGGDVIWRRLRRLGLLTLCTL